MSLAIAVLLTAQTPDPGSPSTISLGASLGAVASGLTAWLQRLPHDRVAHHVMYGSLFGGACGVVIYLAMYLL